MKLRLVGTDSTGLIGYYELPMKPDDPRRPLKAIVRLGPREYYLVEAWVDHVGGTWVLELPIVRDYVELIDIIH